MKGLIGIFVSLVAMAAFAMVGSAAAGNIAYDPSFAPHIFEEPRSMTQETVPDPNRSYGIQRPWVL